MTNIEKSVKKLDLFCFYLVFLLQIVVCLAFVALASAAKTKRPIAEYFSDFAGEEDIHLITGDDDRPPVNFQGDVMKARTTSIKTLQGQGKFNYK